MATGTNLENNQGENTGVEIISVHVPKSVGSTFTRALLRVYGPEAVLLDYPYDKDYQLQFMKKGDAKVKVIHGHFPITKYQAKFPDAKRIIWLREPINFLISYYCFSKAFKRTRFYDLLQKKKLSFWEFAQIPENQNIASAYLKNFKLKDFYFVGIEDFFEEDFNKIKKMLSWPDIEISKENNNIDADYTEVKNEIFSDISLVEKVINLNYKDWKMYQQALSLRNN